MPNQNLPIIGICRRCRRPAAGQMVDGEFFCHECSVPRGTIPGSAFNPHTWFYTFTTSNSTGDDQN